MFELIDQPSACPVADAEYQRLLGFPPEYDLAGRPRELAEAAREWYARHGRPWIYAREMDGLKMEKPRVHLNGASFSSALLHDTFSLAQAHGVVLAVVSAGRECEERARTLWEEGKPDEYFFMEAFGSAVVEYLVTVLNGQVCAWADGQGMAALPHYSPGYSGWDVADQPALWQLIRERGPAGFPGPLDVLPTGMLRPKKSLLTVIGLTRHAEKVQGGMAPCETCALPKCQYRRAAYRRARPPIEDVQPRLPEGRTQEDGAGGLPLDLAARYLTNQKALRKWSEERLQLATRADGKIEARFRYEGTTCSNMGRPLEYNYEVLLGGAAEQYRILACSCRPAPGDAGHALQCEYLKDGAALSRSIDAEKPLLGRPLNDVLAWERPSQPSGCYCDADRRLHKWGLVYEVIHFALAHPAAARAGGRAANDGMRAKSIL